MFNLVTISSLYEQGRDFVFLKIFRSIFFTIINALLTCNYFFYLSMKICKKCAFMHEIEEMSKNPFAVRPLDKFYGVEFEIGPRNGHLATQRLTDTIICYCQLDNTQI